jgi:aspartyl-tRNA(Asn)/glutamyl-tRNA(Gln) amidotransferase subunit C
MEVDKNLISRLEELARLELSESEREALRKDLNEILGMVEKLQELDLEGVEPLIHIGEALNLWRRDEVTGQVARGDALRNAPDREGPFFRVPKVIDL